MLSSPIRVLLVDDSMIALQILQGILSSAPDIHVVGTAKNGKEGLDLVLRLRPDVVCTDLYMPVMDGLEFTKEVMARLPTPILVVSVSVHEGSANVFRVLEAGAIDVVVKPRGGTNAEYGQTAAELISKIRVLSGVVPIRNRGSPGSRTNGEPGGGQEVPGRAAPISESALRDVRVVAIGASTGGPQALDAILAPLPRDFPAPIVCVQHIGGEFASGFVEWLASRCKLRIAVAEDGALPQSGTVHFPKPERHLKIDGGGKFELAAEPPVDGHRPSITVMFESVARYFRRATLGVILTGMGRDGAEGLMAVRREGGITIAQDEQSSAVFGIPKAAIALGAAKHVLALRDIAQVLKHIGDGMERRHG